MVGERPQTRTPAVFAWTIAILGRLWPPAFLRSVHATLSSLFADPWRAGPALAGTAARWVSPASSASADRYGPVAVVFVTGCALRVILSFLNQEANDDHMSIIRTIAFEDRVPGLRDDWQGYQPKLYHWTVALLLRLLTPWVADSGDVQVRIANLVNCAAGIALLLVARSWLKRSSLPTPAVLMIFGFLVLNPTTRRHRQPGDQRHVRHSLRNAVLVLGRPILRRDVLAGAVRDVRFHGSRGC